MLNARRRWLRSGAALVVAAALLGACSDDGGDEGDEAKPASGGSIVVGLDTFPTCLNPITCGNVTATHVAVDAHVLPRLMELDRDGNFVPSPVLDGEPELSGAGTGDGDGPFTVTYTIHDDAVWDDGSPITSKDVAFTWRAYLETTGSLTTSGYDQIDDVSTASARKVAIRFKAPYASWPDLFGGTSHYVLKAAAFEGPDTAKDLSTSIGFSGGPFRLTSFSPTEAVLERNERYWDDERRALLDQVTVVPQTDPATAVSALEGDEVDALLPRLAPGLLEQLRGEGVRVEVGAGTSYAGIWFNQASRSNTRTPLRSRAVREALLFAIDREAILERVVKPDFPKTTVLNCGAWVPSVGPWCGDEAFADVERSPAKVASLLEGDGWAKGPDGIYAKAGQRLSIAWTVPSSDPVRTGIQTVVIPSVRELGIELRPDNADGPALGPRIGQLQFEMISLNRSASPDPSVTELYACDQRATPENDFTGGNVFGWCNEEATALMKRSDATPELDARAALIQDVDAHLRRDAVLLPLYQAPLVTAWSSARLAGPVGAFTTSPYGGFANLYDWYLAG